MKKEPQLDPVPEDNLQSSPTTSFESPRPRPNTTQSDGTLSILTANNYKPIHHKHNDMAHKCGAPYKRERPHTIHGHAEVAQRSLDGMPPLSKRPLLNHEAPFHPDSVTSAPQLGRRVKSEHGSPVLSALAIPDPLLGTPCPPNIDSSYVASSPTSLPLPVSERYGESYFATSQDYEAPLHSAGLKEPVDWSSFNIPENNKNYSATVTSQPHSYPSFDWNNHLNHPGFTSSSGEISEADEFAAQDRLHEAPDIRSDTEFEAETEGYRHSGISEYGGIPMPTNTLASSNLENLDIDDYLKNAEEETRAMHQRNLEVRNSMSNSPLSAGDPTQANVGTPDFSTSMRMDVKSSMSNSPISSTDAVQQTPAPGNPDFSGSLKQEQFSSLRNTPPPGLGHSLTVHDAQRYAHMSDSSLDSQARHDSNVRGTVGSGADDPIWSYSGGTPSTLNLMEQDGSY